MILEFRVMILDFRVMGYDFRVLSYDFRGRKNSKEMGLVFVMANARRGLGGLSG